MTVEKITKYKPLFIVATISYNSELWIEDTIRSVLNSSFTYFEYIICDDSSHDRTWEIIQKFNDN